jgi:hypothetical protein
VLLAGAVLLAVILGASSFFDWKGPEPIHAPGGPAPEAPAPASEPTARESLEVSSWDPSGPPVAETEDEPAAPTPAEVEAGLEVLVLLTEHASGLPLAAHRVVLVGAGARAKGVTDAGGRARLLLAGAAWTLGRSIGIEVRDADNARIYWGSVPLAREMHLALPSRVRLHGKLECEPPLAYQDLWLTVSLPTRQAITVALWCGSTQLAADGSFEMRIFEPVPTEDYLLKFSKSDALLAEILVPRAELVSEDGALVRSRSCEFVLHFTTAEGEPVAGVELRLCPLVGAAIFAFETDAHGDARLFVREDSYQLCAGKAGFRTLSERIVVDGSSHLVTRNVVLQRLADSDRVRGTVRASTGEPVAGAFVTLMPSAAGDAAVAAAAQQEADAAGAFDLPVERGTTFDLAAYHSDHGLVELDGLLADGNPVEIRFRDLHALGTLVVEPLDLPETDTPPGGPWQFLLVPGAGGRTEMGYDFGSPWTIEELEAGEYELLVQAPGAVAFGKQSVRVLADETVRAEVALSPMRRARGTLARPASRADHAWELELRPPGWPVDACRCLGRARVRADGSFEIPVAELRRVPAVILEDGREIAAVELRTDESNALAVPAEH